MATVTGGDGLAKTMADLAIKLGRAKEVRVGFLEGATYPDGTPVAMIAAIQNFGAPAAGIPARPFFSNMVADKSGDWGRKFGSVMQANEYDSDKSLALMGDGIAGQLAESIIQTQSPPNSPVTNLLKQRFPMGGQTFADVQQAREDVANGVSAPAGKPLEQSGDMLRAIDKEVS